VNLDLKELIAQRRPAKIIVPIMVTVIKTQSVFAHMVGKELIAQFNPVQANAMEREYAKGNYLNDPLVNVKLATLGMTVQ
jgi:hypothetical protein